MNKSITIVVPRQGETINCRTMTVSWGPIIGVNILDRDHRFVTSREDLMQLIERMGERILELEATIAEQ